MLRRWCLALAALWLLAGCSQTPLAPAPDRKTPVSIPAMDAGQPPAAEAVRRLLADSLGVPYDQVAILNADAVVWNDGCLGVPQPDEDCQPDPVSGYRVTLESNGERYIFHTDESGLLARLAPPDSGSLPSAARSAQAALARHLLMDGSVLPGVINYEPVLWDDDCLGVKIDCRACAAGTVAGYSVTLTAPDGATYVFHTDERGERVLLADRLDVEPVAEPLVSWRSSADACLQADFDAAGVELRRESPLGVWARYANPLRPSELARLAATYAGFESETPAGWVRFSGSGAQPAGEAEIRRVAEWAELVAQEAELGHATPALGLILTYQREGGDAGCLTYAVYTSGIAYRSACPGGPVVQQQEVLLSTDDLTPLYFWIDALNSFELIREGENGLRETVRLLAGGGRAPTEEEKQNILRYASGVADHIDQP
jgi:hypothetical protein